ncbi:MAG TPA: AAA family ATPase [Lutibacter sp.]
MGFDLIGKHNKVIYVSTEDDPSSISYSIRKQVDFLKLNNEIENLDGLENLEFIFDTDELYENLSKKLTKTPVDLIIIDAFADVFSKEINANTQVRNFLNSYDRLAKKHQCLILFLHHTGKRTMQISPTKDSIIGSQGFEAKMRVVLEIRPNFNNDKQKDLWVLKSNFLESKYKNHSYVLDFNEDLIFNNTGRRGSKQISAKSNNTELIEKVVALHKEGMSYRKIEEELKNSEFKVSKSVIAEIIKKNM